MTYEKEMYKKNASSVFWTVLKSFIFIACLVCLSYQTATFYRIYTTYPTTLSTEVRRNQPFTLPAVTFCYKNTVPRTTFCSKSPHLCQKPSNLLQFCQEHPHYCRENVSTLVIPKLGYYANYSSEAHMMARLNLLKGGGDVPPYLQSEEMAISFVQGEQEDVFAKCFSERLQLFHGDAIVKTVDIDLSLFSESYIGRYKLHIPEHESLYPWETYQAFFAVHSSFVPINPLREGHGVRPGYHYFVQVSESKEYLLPHPYQTDCVNYNISWMKNNKTGPRSQDACKELCRSDFLKDCIGCDPGRIMTRNPEDLCTSEHKQQASYDFWRRLEKVNIEDIPRYLNVCLSYVRAHLRCIDGCKLDCEKLYYEYEVVESVKDPSPREPLNKNVYEAEIQIYVKNSDIMVMSHKPLYTNSDLYSYIGGLMGLWLGISVWTVAGIAQKSFARSLVLKRKLVSHQEYVIKS